MVDLYEFLHMKCMIQCWSISIWVNRIEWLSIIRANCSFVASRTLQVLLTLKKGVPGVVSHVLLSRTLPVDQFYLV